jgi:hypothetical protein
MNRRCLIALALALPAATTMAPVKAAAQAASPQQQELRARLTAGLRRLDFLVGTWNMAASLPGPDGTWVRRRGRAETFERSMNGLYLVMRRTKPNGEVYIELTLSYDAAMGRYRLVSRDDSSGLLDVYEGDFNAAGELVMSNVGPGTYYLDAGLKHHNRLTYAPTPKGWDVRVEDSTDQGATWTLQSKFIAERE